MSDHAPDAADEVERALFRCTGEVDCPCCAHSSMLRLSSVSASPSGSRTARSGAAASAENGVAEDASSSSSETIVPDAWLERDWSEMHTLKLPRCECRRRTVLKRDASGSNTGRRFFGCPKQDDEGPCMFVDWVDAPWPLRLQKELKDPSKQLKARKHSESLATEALLEAMEARDIANKVAEEMEEEMNRTKRVAKRVCMRYFTKANLLAMDYSKLQYLVRCLLALLLLLAYALVAKMFK